MAVIPSRPLATLSRTSQLLLLALAGLTSATPFPRDDLHDAGYSYLMPRNCNAYCGSDNQFCCESGQYCTTLPGNVATCVAGNGQFGQYTTTWTETHTYTSTVGTFWPAPPQPTAGVDCIPQEKDQEQCGPICCAGWQTCAFKGQCSAKPGLDGGKTVVVTKDGKTTTQYSAPFRVTGTTTVVTSGVKSTDATVTATSTGTADGASGTDQPEDTGGTAHNKLSGGAIAGIVIGTLAGISLLFLLCFCCIVRGLWHAIFGKKKEKHERETVIDEYSSYHGSRVPSAYSRRDRHSGWAGGRPASASDRREKKSDGKKWLGLAGGAATLLALLNMKKDKRPARKGPASRYTESYYSYDSGSSPSSASSGGRTSRTRRTRDSRGSRGTRSQYTRASRRP